MIAEPWLHLACCSHRMLLLCKMVHWSLLPSCACTAKHMYTCKKMCCKAHLDWATGLCNLGSGYRDHTATCIDDSYSKPWLLEHILILYFTSWSTSKSKIIMFIIHELCLRHVQQFICAFTINIMEAPPMHHRHKHHGNPYAIHPIQLLLWELVINPPISAPHTNTHMLTHEGQSNQPSTTF